MSQRRLPQTSSQPLVDVLEREDAYEVLADLPGSAADGIDVSFERGDLTIKALVPTRQERLDHREFGDGGDWTLGLRFGDLVSGQDISAVYEQGVLWVTLPKSTGSRRHRISISES